MANHTLQYVVSGTPAECAYWTIQEMLFLVDIESESLPSHVADLALSCDDPSVVATSYLNATASSEIWKMFRTVRSSWDTIDVVPEDWNGSVTSKRAAAQDAFWVRYREPVWHYYWAFGLFN